MDSIEALAQAYVQHEVFGYLAERHGGDTLTGVVEWWAYRQRRSVGEQNVRSALEALVDRGAVEVHPLPGGDRLYLAAEKSSPPQQQE